MRTCVHRAECILFGFVELPFFFQMYHFKGSVLAVDTFLNPYFRPCYSRKIQQRQRHELHAGNFNISIGHQENQLSIQRTFSNFSLTIGYRLKPPTLSMAISLEHVYCSIHLYCIMIPLSSFTH